MSRLRLWITPGSNRKIDFAPFSSPLPQTGYRIEVPEAGRHVEIFNSDSAYYGGSNLGNGGGIEACAGEWMNRPANLEITLPPLAVVVLQPV